jgi:hypothetical protein
MTTEGRAIRGAISVTINAIENGQREGGLPSGPEDPRLCLGKLCLMLDAIRIVLSEHSEVAGETRAAVRESLLKVDTGDLDTVVADFKRAFRRTLH